MPEIPQKPATETSPQVPGENVMDTLEMLQQRPLFRTPQDAPSKRDRVDPLTRLGKTAAQYVRLNSRQIVEALLTQTLTGDVQSGKLLLSLCIKPPSEEPKKKKRSLATEWRNEPEWVFEDEPKLQIPPF
jgi:hypothetical protein